VQVDVGVSLQELFDLGGLVCGQVVENNVNLLVELTAGDDLLEETDEFRAGVPLGSLALHLSSLDCRAPRATTTCHRVDTQSSAVPAVRATTAALDPGGPVPKSRSSHSHKTRPRAAAELSTIRSRRQPWSRNPDRRWPCSTPFDAGVHRLAPESVGWCLCRHESGSPVFSTTSAWSHLSVLL
jgi:hypothetical protein